MKFKTLFLLGIIACTTIMNAQVIYYVTPSGAGTQDGLSWANAKPGSALQTVLYATSIVDQVWIAAGIYKPTHDASHNATPADPRTKCIQFGGGAKIYGGFAGTETSITERNITANKTIFSGDLSSNDNATLLYTEPTRSDNAYHTALAFNSVANSLIDGVYITGGNATNAAGNNNIGGGLFVYGDGGSNSLKIQNVSVYNNTAVFGGALAVFALNSGSVSAEFSNCSFYSNCAQTAAAIYNSLLDGTNTAKFFNCAVYGNKATNNSIVKNSAGMTDFSPTYINCTVTGNYNSGTAGNIFVNDTAPGRKCPTTITNTIIWNNRDMNGPITTAISVQGYTPIISYSLIEGHNLSTNGNLDGTNASNNPKFNQPVNPANAPTATGDIRIPANSPCIDKGNNASNSKTTDLIGDPRIYNTTIDIGASEYNKIVWYITTTGAGTQTGRSWSNARPASQLQNTINNALFGHELWVAKGKYNPTQDTSNNTSPSDNRTKTFRMKNGVNLYGSFAGTETSISQRIIASNKSALNGDLSNDDNATITASEPTRQDNAYHVVTFTGNCEKNTLDGFTISGGNANSISLAHENKGGGILMLAEKNSTFRPSISQCTIAKNTSLNDGPGVFQYIGASVTCSMLCSISATTFDAGNDICSEALGSSTTVTNCTLTNSGFISIAGGSADYKACTINSTTFQMANNFISLSFDSCTLNSSAISGTEISFSILNSRMLKSAANISYNSYGGMNIETCLLNESNLTFSSSAYALSGGIVMTTSTMYKGQINIMSQYRVSYFRNCIIWNTTVNLENANFGSCDVQGSGGSSAWKSSYGTNSGYNLDTDPLFADVDGADNVAGTADDDLHLQKCSPCINTGSDSYVDYMDLDKNLRLVKSDIGVYEYSTVLNNVVISKHPVGKTLCYFGSMGLKVAGSDVCRYKWQANLGSGYVDIPGEVTDTLTLTNLTPSKAGKYRCVMSNANGDFPSNDATIAVQTIAVTPNASKNEICKGESVKLYGSAVGTGSITYAWDNSIIDNADFTPASTKKYTVIGSDALGCKDTADITVTVNTLPTVVAGASKTEVCKDSKTTLSGSGAQSYVWNKSVVDGVEFTPDTTSDYIVEGTDTKGCKAKDTITITVSQAPSITLEPQYQQVEEGGSATLTTASSGGSLSYQWKKDGADLTDNTKISGSKTASLTITKLAIGDIGVYTCQVSNACGSKETDTTGLYVKVIGLESVSDQIRVFPNPVTESFNIDLSGIGASDAIVQIINAAGQMVFDTKVASSELGILNLNTQKCNMSKGFYLIRIICSDITSVIRIKCE